MLWGNAGQPPFRCGVSICYSSTAIHPQFCSSTPTSYRAAQDRHHFGVVWSATHCRAVLDSRHFVVECHTLLGSAEQPPFCCGVPLSCREVQDGHHFGVVWCAHTLWGSTRRTPFWCGVEQCAHTPPGPMWHTGCRPCSWECIIITSAVEQGKFTTAGQLSLAP